MGYFGGNFNYLFVVRIKGGFKLSIITDKYQFGFLVIIIFLSLFLILGKIEYSSLELIKKRLPELIDKNYLPNIPLD